nr:11076_t:CDS:2 [Entrophospora candida]
MESNFENKKMYRKSLSRPERNQVAPPLLTGKTSANNSSITCWILFSKIVTFWAPGPLLSSIGGLNDRQSKQAWREKITLCFIALLLGSIAAFLTMGFQRVLCPLVDNDNPTKFKPYLGSPGHLGVLGFQYNIEKTKIDPKKGGVNFYKLATDKSGQDITNLFQRNNGLINECQINEIQKFAAVRSPLCQQNSCVLPFTISNQSLTDLGFVNTQTRVGYDWDHLPGLDNYIVIDGNVLNLNPYIQYQKPLSDDQLDVIIRKVLSPVYAKNGKDATRLFFSKPDLKASVNCLVKKYYAGSIDKETIGCFTSRLLLYIALVVVLGIVLTRFTMACIFSWFISPRLAHQPKNSKKYSSENIFVSPPFSPYLSTLKYPGKTRSFMTSDDVGNDLFTVLLVTCYSEGEAGIRTTCESMAATDYPDDRKLLFLICDGIITGSGNDRSTPDVCVGLMELDTEFKNPQPMSYKAVADGSRQHNMAKVYAGHFILENHCVPMIVVVKCGNSKEQGRPKPGNRGKRDSQLILMNFFSRVTYNDRMTELDYDLFRKIHYLMGVTPDFFEIVLMVDADTKVYPNSLQLLINCMCNDPLIMGVCGETKIANKRDSWVTSIQVFEYYISHHLGKGFESVFGGVTCLPGCFSMYRLKSRKGKTDWVPIITKPEIVKEYSQNEVETLHQKNLLLLGEDRFLTTLMLRNFPTRKMIFCPKAVCKTTVPSEFKVLLSQRRRWINSTIHNLMELVLVRNLCGTFCFSMQFVVFMELIGTVVLPIAILLTYALIISMIIRPPQQFDDMIPLIMLGMLLGLPAILILITTRKLVYIGWMFVYIFALPIWSFILPSYAYWHFDDFSWGETRKVEGEEKSEDHSKKEGEFNANNIPLKKWEDWERPILHKTKQREKQNMLEKQQQKLYITTSVKFPSPKINENGTISSNYSQKTQEFTPQQHQAHHYNNYQQHQANKKSKKSQDLGYEQPQDSFYGQEQGSAYQQPGIDLYQQPQNTYYEQPSLSSNFEQLGSQFEESKNNFFSKVKSSFK